MFHGENHFVRTHDLLEIDAKRLLASHASAPQWVKGELRKSPFAVVRRGPAPGHEIPIGVRGTGRNQRWAAFCHSKLVKSIFTPSQLLTRAIPTSRAKAIPALRALDFLKERWMGSVLPWGPGGSVGFELASGGQVVTPESDLDIVIYAESRITAEEAKSLCDRAMNLPVAVDIRVETSECGFSLKEFAGRGPAAILLRVPRGIVLAKDPWGDEIASMDPNCAAPRSIIPTRDRERLLENESRRRDAVLSENEDDVETCLTGREGVHDGFEYIVGASKALREVLELVRTVAPTDSTALIEGETGTGKELIARAIHEHSTRRDRPFLKVNCAAIPLGLLESELFGHERGAFTGAVMRKVGRFEAANQGTLFLDEVGDIPPELQPKLLRVLQDGEFERLGSTQTQRANVRLIAATNKDLARLVAKNQFRNDLYYRLNVFPILVPPLRDRRGDIPSLVMHFVRIYAERMKKKIDWIPTRVMEVLVSHSWPGNIRELQNFIERSVILTDGNTLRAPRKGLQQTAEFDSLKPITLEEAERRHIRKTLEQANWVVAGPSGAAVRLGMKRSTVYFRMRKLGIFRA